jgi:hypothetical protein
MMGILPVAMNLFVVVKAGISGECLIIMSLPVAGQKQKKSLKHLEKKCLMGVIDYDTDKRTMETDHRGSTILNRGEEIKFHLDDLTDTEKRLYTEKEDVELEINYTEDRGFVYYPLGVKHIHGVHFYPDGSGEPDSEETYELGDETGYAKAFDAVQQMMYACHEAYWKQMAIVFYEQVYLNQDQIDKELYGDTILTNPDK